MSYRGVRYSVAPTAAGHTVTIRPSGELVGDAFVVLLGDQVVATHQRRARGTPDVTLPEHRAAVQALTRGQSATARRPGQHRPHFVQQSGPVLGTGVDLPGATLAAIRALAPVVEVCGLAQYEAMLTSGTSRTGVAA